MAKLLLWNSVARRRRSISDTFYDNGLATLRSYLEERGHEVEVVDWARDDFFQKLSLHFITVPLRFLYKILFRLQQAWLRKPIGLLSLGLQGVLNSVQNLRLRRHIRELVARIKKEQFNVVGVKVWYGEAFSNAADLVEMIKKELPDVVTIAGGYHTTLYEEYLFEGSQFDMGVMCEGEHALDTILKTIDGLGKWDRRAVLDEVVALAEKGELQNFIYRKDGKIYKTSRRALELHSSKTIPQYTIDDNKVRIHVMVESLGCDWGKCNFCVHSHFYPRYSLRDPDEIIAEIKAMLSVGIGIFRFAGSDTPPGLGTKIARKIIENDLKIVYGMGSRAIKGAETKFESLVSSYSTMIKSGMRAVFMGGECGNDFINLEVMNKGITFEDIVSTVKALREAEARVGEKVYLSLALIYPPPLLGQVTLDEVRLNNVDLLRSVMPDSVMISPPGPFLHTCWFREQERFGFKVRDEHIRQMMKYEYVLYKPPDLWPELGITLEDKDSKQILAECGEFRKHVESELHIPCDISDEHFLMFYAAGIRSKEDILNAKHESLLDIVSCDYRRTRDISAGVNAFSKALSDEYVMRAEKP